jgi:CDGSH-type Zn-finger protein
MFKITAIENGPYMIETDAQSLEIEREGNKEEIKKNVIYLCRCGHSNNKPFCDGSHSRVGFQAKAVKIQKLT